MVSDFETNTIYFSKLLLENPDFISTANELIAALSKFEIEPKFIEHTNDIWARDFMPLQINKNTFLEFRYDPDYLQGTTKDRRELKSYPDIICQNMCIRTKKSKIILDGGNVVKTNNCAILTDKVFKENQRYFTKTNLEKALHEELETEKLIFIPWDKYCEFGHSDGMLRFIDNETVLISGFYKSADERLKSTLLKSLEKQKINWKWLNCGKKEKESNISYINFLQTKDIIIIPKLNQKEDEVAFYNISDFYPDYGKAKRILQVDATVITKKSGALNCISWTILE